MRKHLVIAALAIATALAAQTNQASASIDCDKQGCREVSSPRSAAGEASHRRGRHAGHRHSRSFGGTHQRGSQGQIVDHPSGCPWRVFCGCGVAARVFGPGVRYVTYAGRRLNLWLASEWKRFPPAALAPGMVAARNGHVVYVESVDADGSATVYDPNSGGHRTKIHKRNLAGFKIVDPHGGRMAQL